MYQTSPRGSERQDLLVADDDGKWPVSWSADGKYILYVTSSPGTANDIWVLPLAGDRKPYPFLKTESQENWAAFSPNGKWVAYSSTESGQAEVYVTPFPKAKAKWLVSRNGGFQARWRRDGKELFFMSPDSKLMAADVNSDGSDFEVSGVKALFETHFPYAPYPCLRRRGRRPAFSRQLAVARSRRPEPCRRTALNVVSRAACPSHRDDATMVALT